MSNIHRRSSACLLLALAAFLPLRANAADGEAIIEQIRADWRERFEATKTFVYHAKGRIILPAGSMFYPGDPDLPEEYQKTGYPLEDQSLPYERTWSVDKERSLIRLDVHEFVFDVEKFRRVERWKIEAYDGEMLWTGRPDSSEYVTRHPSSRASWFFNTLDFPPFLAHGRIPLGGLNYTNLSQNTMNTVSFDYVGTAIVKGRDCQMIDCRDKEDEARDTVHRFYVDLSRQSAVLRYEMRYHSDVYHYKKNGGPIETSPRWLISARIDIDHREHAGLWIPSAWTKNNYYTLGAWIMPDGALTPPPLSEVIIFDEVTARINEPLDPSIFEQPLETGTVVGDRRGEEYKTFQVAEDGETLVPLSRVGSANSGGWNFWIIAWAVLGVGFIVAALILRARAGRSSRRESRSLLGLLIVLTAVLSSGASAAADDAIIEQIRADWMKRYHAYDSFVYKSEGHIIDPKGSVFYPGDPMAPASVRETGYPTTDLMRDYARHLFVDVRRPRIRVEVDMMTMHIDTLEIHPDHQVDVFDGKTLWSANGHASDVITLQPKDHAEWFFSLNDLPVFFSHGLFPLHQLAYENLTRQTAKTLSLRYIGDAIIAGRACDIIEIASKDVPAARDRVFVDRQRQSAILRFERELFSDIYHQDDWQKTTRLLVPWARIDISYAEEDDGWWPNGWEIIHYDVANARLNPDGTLSYEIMLTSELDVVDRQLGPDLDDNPFEQPRMPGTVVQDLRGKELQRFVVAADGKTLVPLSRVPRREDSLSWTVVMAVAGVVLIGLGLFLAIRRSRQPETNE